MVPACVILLGFFATTEFSHEFERYAYPELHIQQQACDTPVGQEQANKADQANSSPCN